ncbi:MAG: saccharopine dehydrogenase family protein [Solirubrobacteraceae bacterium]
MRVAVLGAGGVISPAIVRDLGESVEASSLHLLDLDGERAAVAAQKHGAGKASAAAVDATDQRALAAALTDSDLLVNAASYRVNLPAMDAALAAGCHYVDLGGLYHVARRQYERGPAFERAGLTAVLGCGAGPGKTNVMAAWAAADLDAVAAVHCASAGLDEQPPDGLALPYALATLVDEVTVPPVVVRDGEAIELEALAPGGEIAFPEPVGVRTSTIYTLHSEVLTLPATLGARECDFRLSLGPGVLDALVEAVRSGAADGAPRPALPSARTWSAQRVDVTGTRAGEEVTVSATALTAPHERWGLGGGIVSTGAVAAATVRLLARGALGDRTGTLPPEVALRPEPLFAELSQRGCRFDITTNTNENERGLT